MAHERLRLFAPEGGQAFAQQVAAALGTALSPHEERTFDDGEHKARSLVNVRGADVYVVQSLYSDTALSVNDKLVRLLFFAGALVDAAAARVTVVVPYLCYARKDRRTQPRDPITTRYVARLFEAVGVDRVVALDVHNVAAFQNAFRCHTDHLEAKQLQVGYFAPLIGQGEAVVVSPDAGGVKRAEAFRQALEDALGRRVPLALMEKFRAHDTLRGEALAGDVRGRTAVILDDMIATGSTMVRAARACRGNGAVAVHAAATHGVFTPEAFQVLDDPALDGLVVTNSIPAERLPPPFRDRLAVIDVAPLVAEAIGRLHGGGSIAELLGSS